MKALKKTVDNESPPRFEEQGYWATVLELGVIITKDKSGLASAAVQRSSKFISMP